MTSRADVERLRLANNGITSLAQRDLRGFFGSLNLERPERSRDALLTFIPILTAAYGEAAATVAADWYDELRADSTATGRYTATMAPVVAADVVQKRTRFGASHLFTDAPDGMLPFLEGIVDEYVLQPGRDTVSTSASEDAKARWAVVPSGANTCEFCAMLAGRGAVYHQEVDSFHAHCNCVATPIWEDEPYPSGYDPDAYFREYREAQQVAGGDAKDILAEMRRRRAN